MGTRQVQRYHRSPRYRVRCGTPEERVWAVGQLGVADADDGDVKLVLQALEAPTPAVRHASIAALEQIGSMATRDALIKHARTDVEVTVRIRALEATVGLDPETMDDLLRSSLADPTDGVRAGAVRLVCRYGRTGLLDSVSKLAEDSSSEVRRAVRDALELLGPEEEPGEVPLPTVAPEPTEVPLSTDGPDPAEVPLPTDSSEEGRVVWEAELGIGLRDNFERAPYPGERHSASAELDPMFQGLAGHSGDGWVRCLEGAGSNHPQFGGRTGALLVGQVAYPIEITKAGRYRLWARMWFMDKCGDSFRFWVDNQSTHEVNQHTGTVAPSEWRTWLWFTDPRETAYLSAGRHVVHVEAREDGIRLDQFCLAHEDARSPRRHDGAYAYTQDPSLLAADGCDLSISRDRMVVGDNGRIRGTVFALRRGNGAQAGVLQIDPADGTVESPQRMPIVFDGERRLVSRSFVLAFGADSPCAERVITASLTPESGGEPAQCRLIVTKPWPWQLAGPFQSGDDARAHLERATTKWKTYPSDTLYGRYGMMDFQQAFGRQAAGLVVLRARIRCSEDGEYLWLLNSDDQSTVWMNGVLTIQNRRNMPAAQTLVRRRVKMSKGEHLVEAAVWQRGFSRVPNIYVATQNYWQFRLRIRRDPAVPAPVRGIPME